MDVITVVGARPQFIKAAVVSKALAKAGIAERIIDTGQHYDAPMSSAFIDELTIPPPTWSLGVGSGRHGVQTGSMLVGIEDILVRESPDAVVLYGDTNSTLAGALAASKLHIPIAHVESGLRSYNRAMPEELNRVITDHLSALLFAPTDRAVRNLASEGIVGDSVRLVGDVMFDLVVTTGPAIDSSDVLERLGLAAGEFVLATIHRAENTDDEQRFRTIVGGLADVAARRPVVWPVHPRSRPLLDASGDAGRLRLVDPVGYVDMQRLLRSSSVVVTDSGGVQKEAFFNSTPCVTLRDETEWTELVELGWNTVLPPRDRSEIATTVERVTGTTGVESRPYGNGDAGALIADAMRVLRR